MQETLKPRLQVGYNLNQNIANEKQTTFIRACFEKLTNGFKLQTIANLLWPKDFNLPQPTMVEMGISNYL
jgi:hypothetical protein